MHFPEYIAGNTLSTGATITATSGVSTGEDLTKLHDKVAGSRVEVQFPTTSPQRINIDFGAAISPADIVIVNHSFSSGVSISAHASSSTGSTGAMGTFTHRARDMRLEVSSTAPHRRYWAIEMVSPTATTGDIGELVFGTATTMSVAFSHSRRPRKEWRGPTQQTELGLRRSANVFQERTWGYVSEHMTTSQTDEVEALFDAAEGDRLPFVWCEDASIPAAIEYVNLGERDFDPEDVSDLYHRVRFSLVAQPSGIRVPLTT